MEKEKINSTLCYIEKDDHFLMLFRNKKKNDPCEGKWVGVGGKFEAGEDADACVKREVWEETGLVLTDYHFHGVVHFLSDVLPNEDMYLYTASGWEGKDELKEEVKRLKQMGIEGSLAVIQVGNDPASFAVD